MNFLELIGFIACAVIFVYLANAFLDANEKANRKEREKKRELELFIEKEKVKKEEYDQWAFENPQQAKEEEEKKKKMREDNEQYRKDIDDLQDLITEANYLQRAKRVECYEYLMQYKSIGASKYWENSGLSFPSELHLTEYSQKKQNTPWSDINECSFSANTKSLMEIFNVPECELVNLYKYEQELISRDGYITDDRPLSTWHQFIMNKIHNNFMELHEISNKRNATPVYLRRRATKT